MCTRILQDVDVTALGAHYRIQTEYHYPAPLKLPPPQAGRALGARTRVVACARGRGGGPALGLMQWGFAPQGAAGRDFAPLNARSETVADKPLFAAAFRRRRCIVPVSAWYEVERTAGRSVVWRIRRADGTPAHLAAIWNRKQTLHGPVPTLAVLTTRPLPRLARIHDRQPSVLPTAEACAAWLDPQTPAAALAELARSPGADEYALTEGVRVGT